MKDCLLDIVYSKTSAEKKMLSVLYNINSVGLSLCFGPKFGFLLSLTIYIEVLGHMIAQNKALDETRKLGYQKNI